MGSHFRHCRMTFFTLMVVPVVYCVAYAKRQETREDGQA